MGACAIGEDALTMHASPPDDPSQPWPLRIVQRLERLIGGLEGTGAPKHMMISWLRSIADAVRLHHEMEAEFRAAFEACGSPRPSPFAEYLNKVNAAIASAVLGPVWTSDELPPGWHRGTPPRGRPDAAFVRGKVYAKSPDEAWSIWQAEHAGHERPDGDASHAKVEHLRALLRTERARNEAAADAIRSGKRFDREDPMWSPAVEAAMGLREKVDGERRRHAATLARVLARESETDGTAREYLVVYESVGGDIWATSGDGDADDMAYAEVFTKPEAEAIAAARRGFRVIHYRDALRFTGENTLGAMMLRRCGGDTTP